MAFTGTHGVSGCRWRFLNMPIYEWYCSNCGHEEEILQEIDAPSPVCLKCEKVMKKRISKSSFSLKGGGWYKDGYSKPSPKPPNGTK